MAVRPNPIPEEYKGGVPYLNVHDAAAALDFYRKAFGAEVSVEIPRQGDKIAHAEFRIESAVFMLRDEYPEYNFRSPQTIGGTPINLMVFVPDVEALAEQAIAAGARVIRPVEMQFHGDMQVELEDPFGHSWFFTTRVAEMDAQQLKDTAAAVNL
ncbi:VOC family protein [Nocardia cyriacigeorgica]|uniref:VOC family protein n=1 Tax=Nocardia cyriacigeorgica TaxID=135487 RepID=UPI0018931901|nr:VOC family protein [Nocardia cyriacigeorgica]MBF6436806.1 VOC family protein [Nocardia cyriacigeorgica]